VRALNTISMMLLPAIASTENLDQQSRLLQEMYASYCIEHIGDLSHLKNTLKSISPLTQKEAGNFLGGTTGNAWKLQDAHELFILSVSEEESICAVTAKHANTKLSKKLFLDFVSSVTPPNSARKIFDSHTQTSTAGEIYTIIYSWHPDAPKNKTLLTLTTSQHPHAETQVIISAKKLKQMQN